MDELMSKTVNLISRYESKDTISLVVFQDLEGNVPSSSSNIEYPHWLLLLLMRVDSRWSQNSQLVDEVVLPISMHAHGHEVIHDIVLIGN
jgi:hypothetical protein